MNPYIPGLQQKAVISAEARHDAQNFSESVNKGENVQTHVHDLNMSEAKTDL